MTEHAMLASLREAELIRRTAEATRHRIGEAQPSGLVTCEPLRSVATARSAAAVMVRARPSAGVITEGR